MTESIKKDRKHQKKRKISQVDEAPLGNGTEVPVIDEKVELSASSHKRRHSSTVSKEVLSKLPLRELILASPVGCPPTSSCFCLIETAMHVSVAPMYALCPLRGIRVQHIDPLTMTYYPEVGGIILGCLDVHIDENDAAKIADDSPFAYVWITAKFLVWRSNIGDILQGRINVQSSGHIGLLVHDVFNASIVRDRIPANWKFIDIHADADSDIGATGETEGEDEEEVSLGEEEDGNMEEADLDSTRSLGYWVDEKGKKVEGKLTFVIENLHRTTKVFSIEGSLLKLGEVKEDLTAPSK
ncbi:hypothetical protein V1511DRAFT_505006 [Dipodascopsis uninucleata]